MGLHRHTQTFMSFHHHHHYTQNATDRKSARAYRRDALDVVHDALELPLPQLL